MFQNFGIAGEFGHGSFKEQYRCFSVAMLPGARDRDDVNRGGKIIMPPSALDKLARLNIQYPMMFEISNPSAQRTSHCGVLEFIAEEGKVHLPYWMMQNLAIHEGELIRIKSATLSVGSYAKFQAQNVAFLDISNQKAVLENALRNFACLTQGDMIAIDYNNTIYELSVLETKPDDAISIIECDMNVEFAAPVGYVDPSTGATTVAGGGQVGGSSSGLAPPGGLIGPGGGLLNGSTAGMSGGLGTPSSNNNSGMGTPLSGSDITSVLFNNNNNNNGNEDSGSENMGGSSGNINEAPGRDPFGGPGQRLDGKKKKSSALATGASSSAAAKAKAAVGGSPASSVAGSTRSAGRGSGGGSVVSTLIVEPGQSFSKGKLLLPRAVHLLTPEMLQAQQQAQLGGAGDSQVEGSSDPMATDDPGALFRGSGNTLR
eukprot:Nk52_evm5s744 gene=Nk52_evmTU5s744